MNNNNNSVLALSFFLVVLGLISTIHNVWGIIPVLSGAMVAFHRIISQKSQVLLVSPVVNDGKATIILTPVQLDLDSMSMVYASDALVEPLYRA
jgi:xanthine/uracil permease